MITKLLSKDVKPCSLEALQLAKAVIRLMECERMLTDAGAAVPDYTGHLTHADYYAEEEQKWNTAADELYDLVHPRSAIAKQKWEGRKHGCETWQPILDIEAYMRGKSSDYFVETRVVGADSST